jgi:hypothetical protein
MKRLILVFALLGLATGIALAFNAPWPDEKSPPIALPEAYGMATQALGTYTNTFHCVSAGVGYSQSSDGEWLFTFCATNHDRKYVFVFLDKKTKPKIYDGVLPPV